MFQLFLMIRHGLLIERLALGLQSSSEIVGSCSPQTGTEFRVASSPWWSSAMFWNHHSTEWPCCQHAKQFGTLENGLVQQWGRPLKSTRESSRMYLIFRRTEMESRISDAAIQSLEGAPWISEKVWKVWLITLAIIFFYCFWIPVFSWHGVGWNSPPYEPPEERQEGWMFLFDEKNQICYPNLSLYKVCAARDLYRCLPASESSFNRAFLIDMDQVNCRCVLIKVRSLRYAGHFIPVALVKSWKF